MYYLLIWDSKLAAQGLDGVLKLFNIPLELARLFFKLDSTRYPILSSLSFDDYDLFSDNQIAELDSEFREFLFDNLSYSEEIQEMRNMISDAYNSNMSILFDPFRKI